jgi:hypothetical protein
MVARCGATCATRSPKSGVPGSANLRVDSAKRGAANWQARRSSRAERIYPLRPGPQLSMIKQRGLSPGSLTYQDWNIRVGD